MMPTLNVLVTAASRRVPLVRALKRASPSAGVAGRVLVTDVNPLSPAVHVADGAFAVPLSADPDYIDAIAAICRHEDIGLVVPTIDDELPIFRAQSARFAARGAFVAVSPLETTTACNDKLETCVRLRAAGVAAAATLPAGRAARRRRVPAVRQAAVRARVGRRVSRRLQAPARLLPGLRLVSPCVQEYLDGPEFTLDVFCDRDGVPISVVPRERVVIRAGVIDRGPHASTTRP